MDFTEFEAASELTVRLREGRWLVLDLGIQLKSAVQDPYPTQPIPLCVEILSPDDRLTAVLAKCDEYLDWGVPMTWILDPENRVAHEYPASRVIHEIPAGGSLTAGPIAIPVSRLFAALEA